MSDAKSCPGPSASDSDTWWRKWVEQLDPKTTGDIHRLAWREVRGLPRLLVVDNGTLRVFTAQDTSTKYATCPDISLLSAFVETKTPSARFGILYLQNSSTHPGKEERAVGLLKLGPSENTPSSEIRTLWIKQFTPKSRAPAK